MGNLVCMICGMNINEKNFNFNKEAFIGGNTKDNIIVCPFCGAPIEYLKEGGEKVNLSGEILNEEEIKILDHAVKLEVFNGDFYKKAAILAKDEKIKKMFASLSKVEYMHANIHKKIGNFKEMPSLRDIDYSKYNSDELLLNVACKREEHAVQYYETYSKKIKNNFVKEVFKVLKNVETEHIKLTDNK